MVSGVSHARVTLHIDSPIRAFARGSPVFLGRLRSYIIAVLARVESLSLNL